MNRDDINFKDSVPVDFLFSENKLIGRYEGVTIFENPKIPQGKTYFMSNHDVRFKKKYKVYYRPGDRHFFWSHIFKIFNYFKRKFLDGGK